MIPQNWRIVLYPHLLKTLLTTSYLHYFALLYTLGYIFARTFSHQLVRNISRTSARTQHQHQYFNRCTKNRLQRRGWLIHTWYHPFTVAVKAEPYVVQIAV